MTVSATDSRQASRKQTDPSELQSALPAAARTGASRRAKDGRGDDRCQECMAGAIGRGAAASICRDSRSQCGRRGGGALIWLNRRGRRSIEA